MEEVVEAVVAEGVEAVAGEVVEAVVQGVRLVSPPRTKKRIKFLTYGKNGASSMGERVTPWRQDAVE